MLDRESMTHEEKYEKLLAYLKDLGAVVVAYSGGIDSALVLKVATDVLGEQALGVTADSPSVPRSELEGAKRIAASMGARHRVIATEEFQNENYTRNPSNRCYYCKTELYGKLTAVANQEGIQYVANGTNTDDLGDHRPGLQAAEEFNVVSPLTESGFSKQEVRELAKKLELEIWDKPASPCLSSRVPYGSVVTVEKLSNIEEAESYLDSLGIRERRVRHFGKRARVEVNSADMETVLASYDDILTYFNELGFDELEVTEFRSGALNDALRIRA
jgi:uncharacterized protein